MTAALENVVVVDENDVELGLCEKMRAHEQGILHRALSVFILREERGVPQTLLQKRATSKYHFGGLWTNTCCSHPRQGEEITAAAERRLFEELGIRCQLQRAGSFVYSATWTNGLMEHEFDHVLFGRQDAVPTVNPDEVDAVRWVSLRDLEEELATEPNSFTPWFAEAYRVLKLGVPHLRTRA